MNQITATDPEHGTVYDRIPKNVARRHFANGETILIQTVNMRPFSMWQSACKISRHTHGSGFGDDFNRIVQEFEYYNTCSERGYYAAFYTARC